MERVPRRRRWRWGWFVAVLGLGLGSLSVATSAAASSDAAWRAAPAAAAEGGRVVVGHIRGVINPITDRYVERVLGGAEGASAIVFVIDTPGGLIDSTYRITGRFLNARVPIVTYVAPSGARAASAGAFITLAGHVAAMAPATNIGAAHPVNASGGDIEGDLRAKAENDAVAQITKIALARGRNAQWAEDAVRKSVSIRDDEAVKIDVVDLVATDVGDLLRKIDGLQVALPHETVRLATAGARVEEDAQNIIETILHLITDPQIAVLLFTLGTYGLIFELSNPSLIFPGIVGVIAIVLALFAFGTLDANAAGIALMVFAVILFVAEIWVPSHGLLTVGGLAALALGTIVLFPPVRPTLPGFRWTVEPWVVLTTTGLSALFFGFIVRESLRYRALRTSSGAETVIGAVGRARTALEPNGIAYVGGEDWTATSAAGAIPAGAPVRAVRVEGVRLIVEPVAPQEEGEQS
ncbi:MAG TPA: nodulation protein NfeD [Candidatus Limnocylindria bacterium]|nr:nodulation protein NfeD [Candidatus Limnocylindria bacterium]